MNEPTNRGRSRARTWQTAGSLLTAVLLTLLGGASTGAQEIEEILSFDVSVAVRPGGRMLVDEAIRVRALGQEIRRGIFRDFPTSFPRSSGLGRIEAPFEVLSVTRDGAPEPYAVEGIGGPVGRGGMRVRIGDADVFLDPGVYTYEIRYETDRWIDFGDARDQFYWNVTGNGWGFPIRSASARITVDELQSAPTLEAWTGYEGATIRDASTNWTQATRTAEFSTTGDLLPNQGLTVRLTFPSGQLTPPTAEQQETWFRLDWGGWVDAGWLVLLVVGIYLVMWRRVGMDPPVGRPGMEREPPEGYSPAALGFIEARGYRQNQLSAALVNMALKGAIRIRNEEGAWTLEKADPDVPLDPEERALFKELLGTRREIALEQSHHSALRTAIKGFTTSLSRRLEREYFVNNRRWFLAGLGLSVVGFLILAWRWRFDIKPEAGFLGLWLTLWTVGVSTLLYRLAQLLHAAWSTRTAAAMVAAGGLALFATPFLFAEVLVTGFLLTMTPSHLVFAAVVLGAVNVLFYHLLERPTLKGRGVLDRLEGFRAYLDGDRNAAPRTKDRAELFERFLPFAIALGMEERWAGAFGDQLALGAYASESVRPLNWYRHDRDAFDPQEFASSIGSGLSSTLSSASSPPSSSGGSSGGGGGSSGGGGGGGGGGGW